jgi:Zn-dependent M28 family amino/carboxypeptidase
MTRLQFASSLAVSMVAVATFAQKKDERRIATVKVTVVEETNGKPVQNAEIVLHPVGKDGKQKEEGLELKSHEDGKAESSGIPFGKIRVQVIARGFRTFGQDYDMQKPNMEITIKLQKPSDQFSIYK